MDKPSAIPEAVLKQLAPIVQPEPVSLWPLAPGWWILAGLIFLAIGCISYWLYRRAIQRRYRKQALQLLDNYWQHYQHQQNLTAFVTACSQLLKQVAMTAYGRNRVAGLTGDLWHRFLISHQPNHPVQLPDGFFGIGQYQPQPSIAADKLKDFTYRWINHHV
ncbi:DUF4381 domain-containing protein [Endozoicomonas sp. SM1973]|uniref:DUF4381 domain-containing protein n=1 Tax=Spartinivicinus marinus TaxID=2994442 RepID=A0A853I5Q1_9GAMM|nr:DUF4381 domain-containing protein [Spartinivicinus marinus]MCX4029850.1 DUF4381 domain-containing protein [Spartinivicinus marinus]NYZ64907.1 DUF4381 domain-containing protein [Spartinivicinus marinus]